MTTVFLSGSRKISRLNDAVRLRIQNIVDQGLDIIVGDANGADRAFQGFLSGQHYRNVVVFCSGKDCRNNLGDWQVHQVSVDPKLQGRAFYTQKDKAMASRADYGFVLWDGKSAGSINNVVQLLKDRKKVVVYLSPKKHFVTLSELAEVNDLIGHCEPSDLLEIQRTLRISRQTDETEAQGELSL